MKSGRSKGGTTRPAPRARGEQDAVAKVNGLVVPREVQRALDRRGGLQGAQRRIRHATSSEGTVRLFQAVSDRNRMRLLIALDHSPLCPCLLQEIVPLKNSVLSYHLLVLRRAGLVSMHSRANFRVYTITRLGAKLVALTQAVRSGT